MASEAGADAGAGAGTGDAARPASPKLPIQQAVVYEDAPIAPASVADCVHAERPDDDGLKPVVEVMEAGRALLIRHFMSRGECAALRNATDAVGYEGTRYSRKYRSNDRMSFMAEDLLGRLWVRALPILKEHPELTTFEGKRASEQIGSGNDGTWVPIGLNECVRFCRYDPGGHFSPHCDGTFRRSRDELSLLTFMVYLNEGFEGGTTNFLRDDAPLTRDSEDRYTAPPEYVTKRLVPEEGMLIVFLQNTMLHEGAPLLSGRKYLLRSDIMYRREPDSAPKVSADAAEGVRVFEEAQAAEAVGDMVRAASLYQRAIKLNPDLEYV